MKFLVLDTSTHNSVVTLFDENGMIFGESRLFEKGRSDGLPSLVDYCLKKAKIGIKEIDCFAAGCGPGSFTGLRIGLSVVKAFCYALSKNCLVFSSLDAIAYNDMPLERQKLCVCVDAKRSCIYCRFYDVDRSKNLHPVSDDLLLERDVFIKKLTPEMSLAGDALRLLRENYLAKLKKVQLIDEKFWYPTPESLMRLTRNSYKKSKPLNSFALDVKYLYAKDCQVRRLPKNE